MKMGYWKIAFLVLILWCGVVEYDDGDDSGNDD